MIKGYAYECNERGLGVRTVTDTERGAMVNALVSEAMVFVTLDWGDERIAQEFKKRLSDQGKVVPIIIKRDD